MTGVEPGKLIVISGPSGVGKSTVLREVIARHAESLRMSVSATTRAPRPGERPGIDYHFLAPDEFERKRQAGEFLESSEVFGRGYWYGTLQSEVVPSLEAGKSVILEIDVEGARAILERFPDALTIFVHPGSMAELERRLRERGTESEDAVRRRLEVAARELEEASWYRYHVTNDTVDEAVRQICDILKREKGV